MGLALALGPAGCIDFSLPEQGGGETTSGEAGDDPGDATAPEAGSDPDDGVDEGVDDTSDDGVDSTTGTCDGCDAHGLSGELVMFVNSQLTSAEGLWQMNTPLAEEGTYLGSPIFLYDPDAECDDGTTGCRLARLGHVRLDESLGSESVSDGSLKKFSVRDLAWSPSEGLWGVSFDVQNDEWGIVRIEVPDWHTTDQELLLERWNIVPGDPQSPSTDRCYWQESVSGLGFFGDELLLGVRGLGGVGISTDGLVFRVDTGVMEQGWCVHENDVSQDPHYYACGVLCTPIANFGPALGIAGDLEVTAAGDLALGLVRGEDETVMPFDRAELYTIETPARGELSRPQATGIYAEDIEPGLDIEGLARLDGVLYGIDTLARVWRFDEAGDAVTLHEDLSGQFDSPAQSLKIKGATTVVLAPPTDR